MKYSDLNFDQGKKKQQFKMINNIWKNFKLKMKEKRSGNLLLHFLVLYFPIALSYLRPISFPLMDFGRFFLCVDLLTIWYSGIIFHDLLNDSLEVYQDSRPPAPSTPKGNRRFGALKVFRLKHEANQILPATTEKIKLCLFKLHITSDYNSWFCVNVKISNHAFK